MIPHKTSTPRHDSKIIMSFKMAFSDFVDAAFPTTNSSNMTLGNAPNLPASILEAFIPGFGPISNFLLHIFGLDITIIVSVALVLWLLAKVFEHVYGLAHRIVVQYFTASITVVNIDNIYDYLMKWLAEHPSIGSSRSLSVESRYKGAWEADADEMSSSIDDGLLLNFSNQEAKAPPRFIPHFGTHWFFHKGHYFMLQRVQNTSVDLKQFPSSIEKENLTITCFGRSVQPIKQLLQEAKEHYLQDCNEKTVIRRPASKEMRRYGGLSCWTHNARRPSRPIDTVVLDEDRKREVIRDINEYLHPSTPSWYANRGIPYRRGYLFYGPPGTGKTSLTFALAGIFGLDIYVISLLDPSLTEEDLGILFSSLPRRCIVLLEDIDTAGLIRTNKSASVKKTAEDGTEWKVQDLANAIKRASDSTEEDKRKGISLSGLLNAIDGVASHEGRVLVMTTNRPETLDEALIRPGRIDIQVPFGFATQSQIKELFERMYSSEKPKNPREINPSSASKSSDTEFERSKEEMRLKQEQTKMAEAFSKRVPDSTFSPAELQGFLLNRKKKPEQALADIDQWVENQAALKLDKSKMFNVEQ